MTHPLLPVLGASLLPKPGQWGSSAGLPGSARRGRGWTLQGMGPSLALPGPALAAGGRGSRGRPQVGWWWRKRAGRRCVASALRHPIPAFLEMVSPGPVFSPFRDLGLSSPHQYFRFVWTVSDPRPCRSFPSSMTRWAPGASPGRAHSTWTSPLAPQAAPEEDD